jgi:predicted SprT family Zn-dependent metalloprotease
MLATQLPSSLSEILDEWHLYDDAFSRLESALSETELEKALSCIDTYNFRVNTRLRSTAGQVDYRKKRVELNKHLLDDKYEKERIDTLLHELAHAITYHVYGERGHTKAWREMLAILGSTDLRRCHEYRFLPKHKKRYAYQCKDCGHTATRARRIHKKGKLHLWHHPPCIKLKNRGRYHFIDLKEQSV